MHVKHIINWLINQSELNMEKSYFEWIDRGHDKIIDQNSVEWVSSNHSVK